jgi:hypothetical protein
MTEPTMVEAGDIRRGDRVIRDGRPWLVSRKLRIGYTVVLTLTRDGERIKILRGVRELVPVAVR